MASASRLKLGLLAAAGVGVIGAGYIALSGGKPLAWFTPTGAAQAPSPQAKAIDSAPSAARPAPSGNNAPPSAASRPPVSISVAMAERKAMPVRLEALGTVQTISSVTLRSRVDSQITEVNFQDGARVAQGDVLFRLDSRQIEAQIAQAEANVARDRAALISAEADLRRTDALAKRDFATDKTLDTARAAAAGLQAAIRGGEAQIENLKVQRSYYTITAPISGRVGVAGLKVGNIARAGDGSPMLGVINQIGPIYVAFAMPQRHLPAIRSAIAEGTARALATPQGYAEGAEGTVAVIDNTVDAQTGTLTVRAMFENATEMLWPGALCQVRLTLRTEPNALVVPREAVQTGQNGNFVFEVVDGVARARTVTVDRVVDNVTVLSAGLKGGETIVVDGQQLLADGSRVNVRAPAAPRGAPAAAAPPTGVAPPSSTSASTRGSSG
jgi:membrane fusion protein, multidrug efflux system